MSDNVKEFIELYIDDINNENWEELFTCWYDEVISSLEVDALEFAEFIQILTEAGIPLVLERSKQARINVIKQGIDNVLNELIKNNLPRSKYAISWSQVLLNLSSHCGLTLEDFDQLYEAEDFGANYGLEKHPTRKGWILE